MTHVQGKLRGFIHYNVQYVVCIAAYIILELQFDITLSWAVTFLCEKNHILL
jgi:hypothetical protein